MKTSVLLGLAASAAVNGYLIPAESRSVFDKRQILGTITSLLGTRLAGE
jgi:hypothetical protein